MSTNLAWWVCKDAQGGHQLRKNWADVSRHVYLHSISIFCSSRIQRHFVFVACCLVFLSGACGLQDDLDKKKDRIDTNCSIVDVGCGVVLFSEGGSVDLNIVGAASGDKYVIAPFFVGTIPSDEADFEKNVVFSVPAGPPDVLTEEATNTSDTGGVKEIFGESKFSLMEPDWQEKTLSPKADKKRHLKKKEQKTIANNKVQCPSTSIRIPTDKGQIASVLIAADQVISADDFCIIYVDDSLVEPNKERVKEILGEILKIYKDVVYVDNFPPLPDFNFKPNVVIIDPTNSKYNLPKSFTSFEGSFVADVADVSEESRVPMIYLSSDFSKVSGFSNGEQGKRWFYAALVHELQRAISFYYRGARERKLQELPLLGQALADMMEGVFGYGEETFEQHVRVYLRGAASGKHSLLSRNIHPTSSTAEGSRGAMQALLYYLATRKGSFDFESGAIKGGGALKFLSDLTKSQKSGAENLRDTFDHVSWTWGETVGNFFLSTVVDNSNVKNVSNKFVLPGVFKEVTDMQGTKNKIFGMRFNSFGGEADRLDIPSQYSPFPSAKIESEQRSQVIAMPYQMIPGVHVIADASESYVIEESEGRDFAVAVIRVK